MSTLNPSDTWYYVQGKNFTAGVIVSDGTITGAAPILRRFIGQPLDNLRRWQAVTHVSQLPGTKQGR